MGISGQNEEMSGEIEETNEEKFVQPFLLLIQVAKIGINELPFLSARILFGTLLEHRFAI